MLRLLLPLVLCSCVTPPVEPPPVAAPVETPVPAVTCIPVPSGETRSRAAGWGERSWMDQFADIRAGAAGLDPAVVLIGDSITQSWSGGGRQVGGAGAAARERWLEPHGPLLNAGISGDRTQHVLWRLENGMLEGSDPRVIVLMIGTNNLPHDGAAEIAQGIQAILDMFEEKTPDARLVLLSCPPRGDSATEELRVRGAELNRQLAADVEGRQRTTWLDLDPLLLDDEGNARPDRMAGDRVHFSAGGYDAVAEALAEILGEG